MYSSAYKIKKDFNDKNIDHLNKKKIVDLVQIEKKRKDNKKKMEYESFENNSIISNRPAIKHPNREALIGYKKLSFSSIVE